MTVDWRGFELHPETPAGGAELAQLFGAARIPAMTENLRRFAQSFGITDMQIRTRIPNTRRALAIAEFARDAGRVDDFRHAAMEAWWRGGDTDLESDDSLRAIVNRVGLPEREALAAATDPTMLARIDATRREASRRGVSGIPTFFIGPNAIVGCQSFEVLAAAATRAGATRLPQA